MCVPWGRRGVREQGRLGFKPSLAYHSNTGAMIPSRKGDCNDEMGWLLVSSQLLGADVGVWSCQEPSEVPSVDVVGQTWLCICNCTPITV